MMYNRSYEPPEIYEERMRLLEENNKLPEEEMLYCDEVYEKYGSEKLKRYIAKCKKIASETRNDAFYD